MAVDVSVVGGRLAAGGIVSMSLGALSSVALPHGTDRTRLLGVKVVNKG